MIIHHGDCLDVLRTMDADGLDSCVTDPPYALKFMGRAWDGDVAMRPETWAEVLRVLKPGAQLAAFGGTRTYHRLACAIEDAGFEIRDQLDWIYGSGFPKSHDVGKAFDKRAGAVREVVGRRTGRAATPRTDFRGGRLIGGVKAGHDGSAITAPATSEAQQWQGWGTALKPAHEPIVLARKPLDGTVAENVLRHGCGALNIDGCRVENKESTARTCGPDSNHAGQFKGTKGGTRGAEAGTGRWPPNILHDGSEEVLEAFARFGNTRSGHIPRSGDSKALFGQAAQPVVDEVNNAYGDSGTAARFFPSLGFTSDELRFMYCAKAGKADRAGSKHPTIKPVALIRWLCRLITPPGGTILDPFAGSGTTGQAAREEGFDAVLIEREAEYVADIQKRLAQAKPIQLGLVA